MGLQGIACTLKPILGAGTTHLSLALHLPWLPTFKGPHNLSESLAATAKLKFPPRKEAAGHSQNL